MRAAVNDANPAKPMWPHLVGAVMYVEKTTKKQFQVKLLDANGCVHLFATCDHRLAANEVAVAIRDHSVPEAAIRLSSGW